jgi:nucleotide-binding universal stress UspA family protein
MILDTHDILESAAQTAQRSLTRTCGALAKTQVKVKGSLAIGNPGAEIMEAAKKLRPTYIVMGSHGHNAFYEFVAGSTARHVLREASCPVLVVASPRMKGR